MDDDVKNLFQKFGQSTDAYREIKRDADSEQARQRWPLLRDVHLHAATPARVQQHDDVMVAPAAHENEAGTAPKPVAMRSVASRAAAVKTTNAEQATGTVKPALITPLKQTLTQQYAAEETESDTSVSSPAVPAFLSKIMPASQRENAPAVARETQDSRPFSSRLLGAQAASASSATNHMSAAHNEAPARTVRKPLSSVAASPVVHNAPAAPTVPARQFAASDETKPAAANKPAGRDKSVSAVFGRLAGREETPRPVETGSNSFFQKIFKP